MVKIDLITGFLGSGKTTFIKKYAEHLIASGQNICILENDFGAVNVDMMLLQDLMGDNCELEMVAGACDADCHKRRFKTKLISMGMCGYDRVIVEPSGIYDVDEFFDTLREEPLDRWYEIGTVFTIVDANLESNLSDESRYLLASQLAPSGCVVVSKAQETSDERIEETITTLNSIMEQFQCKRRFGDDVVVKDWNTFDKSDYETMMTAGYKLENHVKLWFDHKDTFDSVYFMNLTVDKEELIKKAKEVLNNPSYGNIIRVKGFIPEEDHWLELNLTKENYKLEPIKEGQNVVIIIGENINKESLGKIF